MSRAKRDIEEREDDRHDAAKRDDRRCAYCNAVVPYGTDLGPNGECPACVGAMKAD